MTNTGPQDLQKLVIIDYTNHRGERALRGIHPNDISFKSTEWHPEPQWILNAHDYNKSETRDFSLFDVHSWQRPGRQPTIDASLAKQLHASMERNARMSNRLSRLKGLLLIGLVAKVTSNNAAKIVEAILKDEEPTWPPAL